MKQHTIDEIFEDIAASESNPAFIAGMATACEESAAREACEESAARWDDALLAYQIGTLVERVGA